MVEIVVTDEFIAWYQALEDEDAVKVTEDIDLLERFGVNHGFPHTSQIKGSKYGLREIRIKSKGKQFRVFYAFDEKQQAVVLLGGRKTDEKKFYKRWVPKAEKLWEEYLKERQQSDEKVE